MDVAQERKGDSARLGELRVGEVAVTADTQDDRAPILDLPVDLSQVRQLGRSDAAPVEAVEGEDDVLAAKIGEGYRRARRRRQGERRRGLAVPQRAHGTTAVVRCCRLVLIVSPPRAPILACLTRERASVGGRAQRQVVKVRWTLDRRGIDHVGAQRSKSRARRARAMAPSESPKSRSAMSK